MSFLPWLKKNKPIMNIYTKNQYFKIKCLSYPLIMTRNVQHIAPRLDS